MGGARLSVLVMACSALVAGAAAGCGAGTITVTKTTTTSKTDTVTETVTRTVTVRAPRHRAAATAATATTTSSTAATAAQQPTNSLTVHDFSGNALVVTVNGVTPATAGAAGYAPTAGNRLVALSLTLTDTGPGTITSDANVDATLTGTDGQTYTAAYDTVSQCTNFDGGSFTLLDGGTQTGCVVFQLPLDVSDQSVQFSLGDGMVKFVKT
jgi:hypothetical protein